MTGSSFVFFLLFSALMASVLASNCQSPDDYGCQDQDIPETSWTKPGRGKRFAVDEDDQSPEKKKAHFQALYHEFLQDPDIQ